MQLDVKIFLFFNLFYDDSGPIICNATIIVPIMILLIIFASVEEFLLSQGGGSGDKQDDQRKGGIVRIVTMLLPGYKIISVL